MKHFTFSKYKLKNYFLALTYLLLGFGFSGVIPYEFLLVILGVYLTVAGLYIRSFSFGIQASKKKSVKDHA